MYLEKRVTEQRNLKMCNDSFRVSCMCCSRKSMADLTSILFIANFKGSGRESSTVIFSFDDK